MFWRQYTQLRSHYLNFKIIIRVTDSKILTYLYKCTIIYIMSGATVGTSTAEISGSPMVALIDGAVTVNGCSSLSLLVDKAMYGVEEHRLTAKSEVESTVDTLTTQYSQDLHVFLSNPRNNVHMIKGGHGEPRRLESAWGATSAISSLAQIDQPQAALMTSRLIDSIEIFQGFSSEGSRNDEETEVGYTLRGIIEGLTSTLSIHAIDPAEIERFVASPLFQQHGTTTNQVQLIGHVVELEGSNSPHIDAFIQTIKADIDQRDSYSNMYFGMDSAVAIRTLALVSPHQATELATFYTHHASAIHIEIARSILAATPDKISEAHSKALEDAELALSKDFLDQRELVDIKRENGINPNDETITKLITFARGVRSNFNAYLLARRPMYHEELSARLDSTASVASRYASDDLLEELLASDPWLTDNDTTKHMVVRRLARTGQVARARELVDAKSTVRDGHAKIAYPINNLLAIYEESGDEFALADAEARIDAYATADGYYVKEYDLIKFAQHRLVAAVRQNNSTLKEQAVKDLDTFITDQNAHTRETALRTSVSAHLEIGDTDTATAYARTLMQDPALWGSDSHNRYTAMGTVIKSLIESQRVPEAEALVIEMAAAQEQETMDWDVISAAEYVLTQGKTFLSTMLGATAVNPLLVRA